MSTPSAATPGPNLDKGSGPGADPGKVRAAGAVVWRLGRKGPEVALIHRPRYDDWSFPKGKLEPGEGYLLAAVREVLEETGLPILLGRRLPTQAYEVTATGGVQRIKKVKYWAARAAADLEFEPNDEVDRLEWLPVAKAGQRLTRQSDADLLESFAALPVDTVPVMLLRHATAVPRRLWAQSGPDEDRPLTAAGQEQAQALVPLLRAYGNYGSGSLVTSAATRCVETLEPFAKDVGVELAVETALSEASLETDPSAATRWLRGALRAGQPVVACTHRPVMPTLLSGSRPGMAVRAGRRPLATAEAWVLHVREGEVLAIDRLKG